MRWIVLVLALAGCAGPGPEAGRAPGLRLAVDGLRPVGSDLRIDFGRAEAGVTPAVSRLLGAAPVGRARRDCGAGPVTSLRWPQGLTLNFRGGDFLGWVAREGQGAAPRTLGGLSVGAPAAGVEVLTTRLGREIEAGGIGGLLGEDGRVAALWAGLRCAG